MGPRHHLDKVLSSMLNVFDVINANFNCIYFVVRSHSCSVPSLGAKTKVHPSLWMTGQFPLASCNSSDK